MIIANSGNGHAILTHGPGHEIFVLIAYAHMSLINAHYEVFSKVRGLNHHLHPYFLHASCEGSEESAHMHICADSPMLAACRCDKYGNLLHMSRLA